MDTSTQRTVLIEGPYGILINYMMAAKKEIERRLGTRRLCVERRTWRWHNLIWLTRIGRRRMVRRQADQRGLSILDYYSPKLFYMVTLVLLLSVLDALLTLWLIEHGAKEMNPIMAYSLKFGPYIFMAVKYLLTTLGVIIVVLFNYAVIRSINVKFHSLMNVFAGCFGVVVAWELFLIWRVVL